ncbi:hypothetical protein Tco_1153675 [Tanacetum coccineum]
MDPNSSVGKTCLGENVIEISSEKVKGPGDWNSSEYEDTANSGGKNNMKALIFHKIDTEEISDRYVAPCFVNVLEAYDGEINLGTKENMISNEFTMKLCMEHEVKRGHKVVKKELIIALRGWIYFVKFIINPEEDDVEPGVVLGRSFVRLTKGIANFGNETITIYPELDPFLDSSGEEENIGDDWDLLLDDLDFGDIPDIEGVEVPQFVKPLTQEKAEKEALAIDICRRYSLLEEERPKKEDLRAFVIPIQLEGKINLNALADTGSDINVMPYRVYKELGKDEVTDVKRGITMLNHSKAEPIGLLKDVIILNTIERITSTFDGICHQTFRATKTSLDTVESDSDDKEEYAIQRNKFGAPIYGPKPAQYLNCNDPMDQSLALQAVLNPFRKVCFNKKEDSDGQWHAEIRLTDPYGNIYDQGFVTKNASRRLSKYHKLSDIMSPS